MEKIDTILFMQARLDSSRLPQKALLPLGSGTSLDMAMQNLYGCADTHVLLSPSECRPVFEPLAHRQHYLFFGGDKEDVLARFAAAAAYYQPVWIIRATADNSLIGKKLVESLLHETRQRDADYGRYLLTPHGGGVEIIKSSALLKADKLAKNSFDREHVCPYIYNNEKMFKLFIAPAPLKWQAENLRATLDTEEDYLFLQKVYYDLYTDKAIELEEFIQWSKQNHKSII